MCIYRPDQHFAIAAAAADNISDVRHVFDSLDWSKQSYRMFEQIGQTEELIHVCSLNTEEVSYEQLCPCTITHVRYSNYLSIH